VEEVKLSECDKTALAAFFCGLVFGCLATGIIYEYIGHRKFIEQEEIKKQFERLYEEEKEYV
jgi:Na+/glutamate symporter